MEKLSIATGIDYIYGRGSLNKLIGSNEFNVYGNGDDFGYNIVAMYKYSKELSFAINYRSYFAIDFTLTANYINISNKTTTELPDILQIGWGYKYRNWSFSLTIDYTNWTLYRELRLKSDTIKILTSVITDNLLKQKVFLHIDLVYHINTQII